MIARGRELPIVLGAAVLMAAPFWGKPFHMDEPFFLAISRHILQDPWHPLAFDFNWYGHVSPMSEINNNPPLFAYLLALALKISGGREWLMRLLFAPFDLAAAAGLYLLAARFLSRPLWPVLVALAAPGYLINMNHLMPEKAMAAFGFCGLYALVRGVEDDEPRWYWGAALLCGAALLFKYAAVVFLPPAAVFALRRGTPRARVLGWLALAGSGLALYLVSNPAVGAAWHVTSQSAELGYSAWSHRLRSVLCFLGGCGLATAVWPFFVERPGRRQWGALALVCAAIFLPAWDIAPSVRPLDRLTGVVLSLGASWGLWLMSSKRGGKGWALWASWIAGVLVLELGLYWSVLARLVMLAVPPLVFASAEALEAGPRRRLDWLYPASFGLILAFSWSLSWVDFRYAKAQKELAGLVPAGHAVWFTGHWGLQYYMEQAGGKALDWSRGGWDEVRPGDLVVVPRVNTNVLRPEKPVRANARRITVPESIPLRLISGWTGGGGFYSNMSGFLPFSFSREPLEQFEIVEIRRSR